VSVHPMIQAALDIGATLPPFETLPLPQARAFMKRAYVAKKVEVAVGRVRHLLIPGPGGDLPMRVYVPPTGQGPYPIVVFFHGSGFVLLDLDTHDDFCRRMCVGASCVVVSVDYRLAPEHPYPAGPDDCLAATRWVAANAKELGGDASRIVVAGDSAGGCFAAVTAIRIRDEGGPALRGQLLVYPVTNYPSVPTESYESFGSGFGLSTSGMQWFWDQYIPDRRIVNHPHVSPLRVANFKGLPSACVLVADYDILRDEGEAYAAALRAAGVTVVSHRCPRMNHGFLKYAGMIDEADAAVAQACSWIKSVVS
jgi:acetyl esterase